MHRTLSRRSRRGAAFSWFACGLLASGVAAANPQGPTVVHGTVSFANPDARTLEIANSPSAIINWQGFDIGAGETTRFVQQDAASAVLNRVVTGNSSEIFGNLVSNGRVFLINPAGILIGRDAKVDTAGLVMSTLDIRDDDFLQGRLHFEGDGGDLVNRGYIKTGPGGEVVLIAPRIVNEAEPGNDASGLIESPGGELVLAAGRSITLASLDHPDITFEVRAPDDAVVNLGRLLAEGGSVGVFAGAIHQGGRISADAVTRDSAGRVVLAASGTVYLDDGSATTASGEGQAGSVGINAGDATGEGRVYALGRVAADGDIGGTVAITADRALLAGTISARGTGAGGEIDVDTAVEILATAGARLDASAVNGPGGRVTVDGGGNVFSSATMTATGSAGGRVEVFAEEVTLTAANLDASGASTGGDVRVGGGFRGGEDLPAANRTTVNAATVIKADATAAGNGGRVAVWADDTTTFAGVVSARGGADSGNGGTVEISGKVGYSFSGQVDVSAPSGLGEAGTVLLDPKNIVFTDQAQATAGFSLSDPHPGTNNAFGQHVTLLCGGEICFSNPDNYLVFDYLDDFGGADAGAVYFFDAANGALLTTLTGSQAGDEVGNGTTLSSVAGMKFFRSFNWNGDRGAITPYDSINGMNGIVGSGNSLVGANAGDLVGNGSVQAFGTMIGVRTPSFDGNRGAITMLSPTAFNGTVGTGISLVGANPGDQLGSNSIVGVGNGNFYVANNHGGAGAVTFFNAANAPKGVVSAANSIVGSTPTDEVGSLGVQSLGGGIYAIISPSWDGAGTDRGAVSFVDGLNLVFAGTGTAASGAVGAGNSLVGVTDGDSVGSIGLAFVAGNLYAVRSPNFDNVGAGALNAGALTWYSLGSALSGAVSGGNSLLGGFANDGVGSFAAFFQFLNSGKRLYVVPDFNSNAGAVAFIDPLAPVVGTLSAITALIGPAPGDNLAGDGIEVIGNHYIVLSPDLQSGTGAVTIASDTTGVTGMADGSNSLVGAGTGDEVGSGGVLDLFNGNAVVFSPDSDGGAGAATYLDLVNGHIFGEAGFNAQIDPTNSLVGTNPGDGFAPNGVFDAEVVNGYYIITSPDFESGSGAVTVIDAAIGDAGFVDAGNSLFGSGTGDRVGGGGLVFLSNGNVLVRSPEWNGDSGAVTYLDLNNGHILNEGGFGAFVSSGNSLVGAAGSDEVGSDGVEEIFSFGGSYYAVYSSAVFNSDFSAANAGAVTFVDSDSGLAGVVDKNNSLVGTTDDDFFGLGGQRVILGNGNVVLRNPQWNGDAGAVTFVDLVNGLGLAGEIDDATSLVGGAPGDELGSDGVLQFFAGGNQYYGVFSSNFDNGGAIDAGAVTFADIDNGVTGFVSNLNSLVGTHTNDRIGLLAGHQELSNGNVVLINPQWDNNKGAVTFVDLVNGGGLNGDIDSSNSLVGSTPGVSGDQVGSGGVFELIDFAVTGVYTVTSQLWNNGAVVGAGAITWGDIDSGVAGVVDGTNSLLGTHTNDVSGRGIVSSGPTNHLWHLRFPNFDGGKSALTFFNTTGALPVGDIDATNSLLGSTVGDNLGSGGIFQVAGTPGIRMVVESPLWDNGGIVDAGAITTFLATAPKSGVVDASNSFVGSNTNDRVGGGFTEFLSNQNRLVVTTTWNSDAGAVTFWDTATDLVGTLDPTNSLVGASAGDLIGDWDVDEIGAGRYYVAAPDWNNDMGALTFGSITTGVSGVVSAANSLVGSTGGDRIGQEVVDLFYTDRLLVLSETWNGSRGSVTVVNPVAPTIGAVSSANSLVGGTAGDQVGAIAQQLFRPDNQGLVVLRTSNWNNDAGAVTVFDPLNPFIGVVDASNSLVGRPGDRVGLNGVTEFSNGSLAVRSSEWSDGAGGFFGAVTFMPASGAAVTPVLGFVSASNSLVGSSLDDRVGNGGFHTLSSGNILVRSPNWFDDRGAVTFVDLSQGATGVVSPVNSLAGELPDDFIGSGGISNLGDDRALVRSPNASVNGVLGAGRLDIIGSGADFGIGGDIGFAANPGGEQFVSIASVVDVLNSGATLILQANNDILLPFGMPILANQGTLRLEAGRSIDIRSNLVVENGTLSLLANAPDRDDAFCDAGEGNITLVAEAGALRVVAGRVELEAQNIFLDGGNAPGTHAAVIGGTVDVHAHGSGLLQLVAGTAPGTTLQPAFSVEIIEQLINNPDAIAAPVAVMVGREALNIIADNVELFGGGSEGAFAALASFGEFNLDALQIVLAPGGADNADALLLGLGGLANIDFVTCDGCNELFFDPLLESPAQSGIYIAGLLQEPTIDAILAMLDRGQGDEGEGDDDDDDDEDEAAECE